MKSGSTEVASKCLCVSKAWGEGVGGVVVPFEIICTCRFYHVINGLRQLSCHLRYRESSFNMSANG